MAKADPNLVAQLKETLELAERGEVTEALLVISRPAGAGRASFSVRGLVASTLLERIQFEVEDTLREVFGKPVINENKHLVDGVIVADVVEGKTVLRGQTSAHGLD